MRRAWGATVGIGAVLLATALLLPLRDHVTSATPALVLLVPCVLAAVVGGRGVGLAVAVLAAGFFNFAFLEPSGTLKVHSVDDAVAFVVFGLVALTVATLVAREGRRRRAAMQHAAEVEVLSREREAMQSGQVRLAAEKQVLEASDAQRSALLRSVSHDLRTPLAAIRAAASELRADIPYQAGARDELLDVVTEEVERLDRLVNNLLSMSRVEAGALRPQCQAVPLDELIDHRVRRLSRILGGVRVTIEADPDLPLASADYTMVDQIVTNLLENAARHSPDGGSIVIGAHAAGHRIEVSVTDQGPGVAAAEADRLFRPFERGPGSRSSGLGLAICRAFVEAHGGQIGVEAANGAPRSCEPSESSSERTTGHGARFTFTLPRHQ